jgi:hypothetical protein
MKSQNNQLTLLTILMTNFHQIKIKLGDAYQDRVEMAKVLIDALTDEEVTNGYILTCQAIPTSSELVISYDD